MVDTITINKIVNGYTVNSSWDRTNGSTTTYHPDLLSAFKSLDTSFGSIEREVLKIREEEKNKKQVRTEDRTAA